jgi:predicted nucleotidyltransferase component of viral defense system
MGKTILTPNQLAFLERLQSEKQLIQRFYWTGGTALSEFYLHHRLSEDIDLFTEYEEVNQLLIHAFLKKIGPSLSVRTIKESHFLGLYSYTLVYKDKQYTVPQFLDSMLRSKNYGSISCYKPEDSPAGLQSQSRH